MTNLFTTYFCSFCFYFLFWSHNVSQLVSVQLMLEAFFVFFLSHVRSLIRQLVAYRAVTQVVFLQTSATHALFWSRKQHVLITCTAWLIQKLHLAMSSIKLSHFENQKILGSDQKKMNVWTVQTIIWCPYYFMSRFLFRE